MTGGENSLLRTREIEHDVPGKSDEAMKLALEQPLLIAVRGKSLRYVFQVRCGADAVALDALLSEVGHVRRPRAHRGNRRRVVVTRHRRLDRPEHLGIKPRGLPSGRK